MLQLSCVLDLLTQPPLALHGTTLQEFRTCGDHHTNNQIQMSFCRKRKQESIAADRLQSEQ